MKLEDGRHACFENYVIDVAKAIGIPGFGERAIKDKDGNYHALNNPDDFFLRAVANVSYDGEPVPDINNHEIELQGLKPELDKWKSILTPEELRKAAFVITRGGRFEQYDQGFIGEDAKYASKGAIKFYMEATATARDSYTGEFYPGVLGWYPERFADGTLLTDKYSESQWPFRGANYKPKFRSVSMLANSKTFRDICKTNFIELNTKDAKKLGVKNGDKVKLTSASGGKVTGNVLVREGVCEGTVAVAFGYGHWEYGARKHQLGDKKIGGNKVIGNGVNLTAIAMMDPTVPAIFGFSEMMTGVPSRNGGRYKIEKA